MAASPLADLCGPLQEDRASVEFWHYHHRADSGFLFPVNDGPIHRRGPAILWQQREMDIDATMALRAQKIRRQNPPISDDDCGVGVVGREQLFSLRSLDFQRLVNTEVVLDSKLLNRRLMEFVSASRGAIGLGPHGDDLMPVVDQATQKWHGGFWSAHEDNSHDLSVYSIASTP